MLCGGLIVQFREEDAKKKRSGRAKISLHLQHPMVSKQEDVLPLPTDSHIVDCERGREGEGEKPLNLC